YPPTSPDQCVAAVSRRGYRQRRLRPGRTSFRWLPPGSFDPLPLFQVREQRLFQPLWPSSS
ncbi:MAG: hypothetical protein ACK53Y_25820, partial [bacterium]